MALGYTPHELSDDELVRCVHPQDLQVMKHLCVCAEAAAADSAGEGGAEAAIEGPSEAGVEGGVGSAGEVIAASSDAGSGDGSGSGNGGAGSCAGSCAGSRAGSGAGSRAHSRAGSEHDLAVALAQCRRRSLGEAPREPHRSLPVPAPLREDGWLMRGRRHSLPLSECSSGGSEGEGTDATDDAGAARINLRLKRKDGGYTCLALAMYPVHEPMQHEQSRSSPQAPAVRSMIGAVPRFTVQALGPGSTPQSSNAASCKPSTSPPAVRVTPEALSQPALPEAVAEATTELTIAARLKELDPSWPQWYSKAAEMELVGTSLSAAAKAFASRSTFR